MNALQYLFNCTNASEYITEKDEYTDTYEVIANIMHNYYKYKVSQKETIQQIMEEDQEDGLYNT